MTTTITIRYDADTLRGFEGSAARLAHYIEQATSACRSRWPGAEVEIDRSQAHMSGATRMSSIEIMDHDADAGMDVPVQTAADEDALTEICGRAWQSACEVEDD